MVDQDPISRGNGSGDPDSDPQVATIAQYIKDLSVESPSSPQAFQWQAQPQLEVQFNINVGVVADDVHVVVLKIEVAARSDQGVHFLIDLSYAGLYGLRNFPEEALTPFYEACGFQPTAEPLAELFELEPEDVHMRKVL